MRSLVSFAALLLLIAGASAGACYSKCTASSSSELGEHACVQHADIKATVHIQLVKQ
jgi:hypothetical protein